MPLTPNMMTAEQWREQAEMWERGQQELAKENARLRRQLDTAREALTEIHADADNHWAQQQPRSTIASIKKRASDTLAALDGEDKADG